jgi:hypothetical protein
MTPLYIAREWQHLKITAENGERNVAAKRDPRDAAA